MRLLHLENSFTSKDLPETSSNRRLSQATEQFLPQWGRNCSVANIMIGKEGHIIQNNLPSETKLAQEEEHLQANRAYMPFLALFFSAGLPTLLFLISSQLLHDLITVLLLIFLIAPILGLILGVCSLAMGKERIGNVGKVLAILAIAVPILAVLSLILLFTTPAGAYVNFM